MDINLEKNLKDELLNQIFGKTQNIEETVSNTQLSKDEIKNIVNKLLLENLDSEIINDNVFVDLEVFSGNNNDPENSIFSTIDKTYTSVGSKRLQNILANPIKDINKLEKRQNIIKRLVKNTEINTLINSQLELLSNCEKDLLWLWKDASSDFNQIFNSTSIGGNLWMILHFFHVI